MNPKRQLSWNLIKPMPHKQHQSIYPEVEQEGKESVKLALGNCPSKLCNRPVKLSFERLAITHKERIGPILRNPIRVNAAR
jgi:hypothetical protein